MLNLTRLSHVLKNLQQQGLSQMLITDPISIFYLTGILLLPHERFYALYISLSGKHKIFINKLEVVPSDLGVEQIRFSDTDPYLDMVVKAVDNNESLGIDKNMAARFLLALMERNLAPSYVNSSLCVDMARAVKDDIEIDLMRKSSAINDKAMAEFKQLIKPGVTELSVANQLRQIYLDLGADDFSFTPIVSFGANSAIPHHHPDHSQLKEGDCVLFDVGCIYNGYCADMTRTFFYKEVSDFQREIYDLVNKANANAQLLVAPNIELKNIDNAAREVIATAGYGEYFTHRLGHFIGLEVHDFGDVSANATSLTQAGNIFSIEPGIYLENKFGVRIEDLVLVTSNGVECLNNYPKDLQIIE